MADDSSFNPALSIIVPIYNVESYIWDCLISIQRQIYQDFEVLMIDDGSTDRSADICKQFTADKRFVCIHKENGGVSSARNLGLDMAQGRYIGFVDPDDYISPDYYSSMIAKLENEDADICQCEWLTMIEESGKELGRTQSFRSRNDLFIVLELGSVVWDKVFKKEIFLITRFDESLRMYEDVEVYSRILRPDIKLVFSDSGTYFYRVREKSLSHKFYTVESFENLAQACRNIRSYYDRYVGDCNYKRENLEKIYSFEKNGKAHMFIQNFVAIAGEHSRKKLGKSILFDMLTRMR